MSVPPGAAVVHVSVERMRSYALWFSWARRELTPTVVRAHLAAQAASAARLAGGSVEDATAAARSAATGDVDTEALARLDPALIVFAEWYDWAAHNLTADTETLMKAARAAVRALERGGDHEAAEKAARRAVPSVKPPPRRPGPSPSIRLTDESALADEYRRQFFWQLAFRIFERWSSERDWQWPELDWKWPSWDWPEWQLPEINFPEIQLPDIDFGDIDIEFDFGG
jgi:hypothetical protein